MLSILREMGHGDELAIVDGNYPANAHAKELVRADGLTLILMLDAVLDILPVDSKRDATVRAINPEKANGLDPIHEELIKTCKLYKQEGTSLSAELFYARVKAAFAIVATSEPALYANVVITKGTMCQTSNATEQLENKIFVL